MQQNYVLAGIVALWFCTAYLGRITKCGLQPDILSLEARACHTTGCKHMEIRDTIECQVIIIGGLTDAAAFVPEQVSHFCEASTPQSMHVNKEVHGPGTPTIRTVLIDCNLWKFCFFEVAALELLRRMVDMILQPDLIGQLPSCDALRPGILYDKAWLLRPKCNN